MDLKSKLRRLEGASPSGDRAGEGQKGELLSQLRSQMAQILGEPGAPANLPPCFSHTQLEWVEAMTAQGPVAHQVSALAPSTAVGRIPVSAASEANLELLSLLALDPSLSRCDPRRALYLDTETTGLGAGAGILAFLVGLAYHDEKNGWMLEQLFLRSPAEEAALLELLGRHLARSELLVTFNGKAFDWPLLATRFVMNRRPVPELPHHLDLLHVARRVHRARLGSVNLTRLEGEVLGLERVDDISGAEIAPRYSHFLRTGDDEGLVVVVDHNRRDVLAMLALVGLYGEPFELLCEEDLLAVGKTFKRARAYERASQLAEQLSVGRLRVEATRLGAMVAKARGDRARALLEFEKLARELDDPAVRLELAKLYEHYVREPAQALSVVKKGTGETQDRQAHRRARLERKLVTPRVLPRKKPPA